MLEHRWDAGHDLGRRHQRLAANRFEHGELAAALEQATARKKLIEHDSERENVTAAVDLPAATLLGRHVFELALELTNLGVRRAIGGFCNSEIEDFDPTGVAHEDVLGRDVAMNQAERSPLGVSKLVRGVQARCGFGNDEGAMSAIEVGARDQASTHEPRGVLALQVLHRDEEIATFATEFVDLNDVAMLDARGQSRLVEEHFDERGLLREMR